MSRSKSHAAKNQSGIRDRIVELRRVRAGDLGSGTTLIAAENLSRVCYGMEISPAYVAVILQRAADAGLTPVLESP